MDIIKEKSVCFSGHRTVRREDAETLKSNLSRAIDIYIRRGFDTFICGGAVGFDTMAAEAILEKKRVRPSVRLVLALPCRDQTSKWTNLSDLVKYREILGGADDVVYTSVFYTSGCMHLRNRYMVDSSSACICYLSEAREGQTLQLDWAVSETGCLQVDAHREKTDVSAGKDRVFSVQVLY